MLESKFNPKKLSTYKAALVDGKWFEVSHFAELNGNWHVWLKADHGLVSGFVECSDVAEWDCTE